MVKTKIVIASERRERSNLVFSERDRHGLIFKTEKKTMTVLVLNKKIKREQGRRAPFRQRTDSSDALWRTGLAMTAVCLAILIAGCSVPADINIPSISKDHPANKFFQAAQQGMLSDRVCRDNKGDPEIPIGKIKNSEGYTRLEDLTPGVFRFRENATGKRYLGVSFLQYSGFLQIPKVCAWEEKDRG